MSDENKTLTPVWIVYVDGKRLDTKHEGALKKIVVNDRLNGVGTFSLLFDVSEDAFGRKVRKYNSTLAGEASAVFSLELGRVATFDCRMVPLPTVERVQDYFRWRQEDANRNALNSHCYWMLRKEGKSVQAATKELEGKGVSFKNELLFSKGINYNDLPSWQKRGIGFWYEEYDKEGYNPMTEEKVLTKRNRVHVEYELPIGDEYGNKISDLMKG